MDLWKEKSHQLTWKHIEPDVENFFYRKEEKNLILLLLEFKVIPEQ